MCEKRVDLTFAGQAGFLLQDEGGYRVGIDLYLSNCCERYFGFKRLMPYLFDPMQLNLDLLVSTHAHYDHFDPDAVPAMMSEPRTHLVAACDVQAEAQRLGLCEDRITYLKEHEQYEDGRIRITAMPCDHGPDTPDAIGLLVEFDGKRIYIAGDTAFREDYFRNPLLAEPDVFILPINGAFGNMNEHQGARAAGIIRAGLTIPCHYWNFAQHGGNPNLFAEDMEANAPDLNYLLMRPGETIRL